MDSQEIGSFPFASTGFDTLLSPTEIPLSTREKPFSQDTIQSSSETASSDEAENCLLRCLNCVKERITSFFNWLCSCFTSRSATPEEIEEVNSLLKEAFGEATKGIRKRYNYGDLNYSKALAPCLLADSFTIFPLFYEISDLCMILVDEKMRDTENPISIRELESNKEEILAGIGRINDLIDPVKHPIQKTYSEEMRKEVENFSLERMPLFKGGKTNKDAIFMTFGLFSVATNGILDDIVAFVQELRLSKGMTSIEPPQD